MKEVVIAGAEAAEEILSKAPLYDTHVGYEDKIVPFARYPLPVQYGISIIDEHMTVRTKCGLFDVSHMGEVICKGPDALKNLNMLFTNDYTVVVEGQARYSPIYSEQGGVVDDLIVCKVRDDCYFIVVNAISKDKDHTWMRDHQLGGTVFGNISSQAAQLALQGPGTIDVLKRVAKEEDIPEKYYTCFFDRMVGGIKCIILETGYTGGDGVEIYPAPEDTSEAWELLMEVEEGEGLIPCGLGVRDTLRLETSMPLYGHEMDNTISPKKTGLGILTKVDRDDFIGKQAIQDKGPSTRKRVRLKVTGRSIIGEHRRVCIGEQQVGMITSGTHCPFLGYPAAMTLIDIGFKDPGIALEADVRRHRVATEVVKLPFYKRQ